MKRIWRKDVQLAENFNPIINKLTQVFKKLYSGDETTQTPSIQNGTGAQSLGDTLTVMRSKNFFKLVEKANGDVFWNGVHIKPIGGNGISITDKDYAMTPAIEDYFT